MALTPEIQTLLETVHESPRGDDWATRTAEAYNVALESIDTSSIAVMAEASIEALRNDTLQEVLRQFADDRILNDLLQITDTPEAEDFEARLGAAAQGWPANVNIFRSDDLEEEGLRPHEAAQEIDTGLAARLQEAARQGDTAAIMATLLMLQQQGAENDYAGGLGNDGEVPGHLSPVGEELFDYIKDLIHRANSQTHEHRAFTPGGREEGVLISLSPQDMAAAIRTEIMEDVRNGTFIVDGLSTQEAEAIANAIAQQAILPEGAMRMYSGQASGGPINYGFEINDARLAQAIDGLFLGDEAVLQADMVAGLSDTQFARYYQDVMDIRGGGTTADDLIEYFTRLVEGDVNEATGEVIEPEIYIPEHMREQFYAEIYEAYDKSREGGFNFDADVFGDHMEEQFGIIDEQVQAAMQHDNYDYGEPIEVQFTRPTDQGFVVGSPDGEQVFELSAADGGFSIYVIDGEGFDAVTDIDSPEDIVQFFGEEGFTVRAVSHRDDGNAHDDTQMAGYFIQTESGQSFYVGFDAIPESGISTEFREQRNASLDQSPSGPDAEIDPDIVIGETRRPTDIEAGLTEWEAPPPSDTGLGPS